ncbi:hypothetical protein LZ554_005748 [Drepanopeziza brunnea f. sp. 'monogermtubi']|nr:hypothetical protein LZ554_005748 [Drepanopeziza brunnea f. sp. 'monogermtubi']
MQIVAAEGLEGKTVDELLDMCRSKKDQQTLLAWDGCTDAVGFMSEILEHAIGGMAIIDEIKAEMKEPNRGFIRASPGGTEFRIHPLHQYFKIEIKGVGDAEPEE